MTISDKFNKLFHNQVVTVEPEPCPLTNNTVNVLRKYSITCKCGGMTVPTSNKGNLFRCIHCTKEHRYINYNLERSNNYLVDLGSEAVGNEAMILNMDYYEDAIKILQKEYKKPSMSFKSYFKF